MRAHRLLRVHQRDLRQGIANRTHADLAAEPVHAVIFDANGISDIDFSGLQALRELIAEWPASKSGLEKSTQSTYSNVMDDHVLPRWKTIPLAAVEFEDVQAWIAELVASGLSGAHVRKIHFVLAGVLQLAVKGQRLPANPAKGVDLPRAKSKDKK